MGQVRQNQGNWSILGEEYAIFEGRVHHCLLKGTAVIIYDARQKGDTEKVPQKPLSNRVMEALLNRVSSFWQSDNRHEILKESL